MAGCHACCLGLGHQVVTVSNNTASARLSIYDDLGGQCVLSQAKQKNQPAHLFLFCKSFPTAGAPGNREGSAPPKATLPGVGTTPRTRRRGGAGATHAAPNPAVICANNFCRVHTRRDRSAGNLIYLLKKACIHLLSSVFVSGFTEI